MTFSQIGRSLTDKMVKFWDTLYANVLLEYMYINKLDWDVPKLMVIRKGNSSSKQIDTWNNEENDNASKGKCSEEHIDSSCTTNNNNNWSFNGSSANNEIVLNKSEWIVSALHILLLFYYMRR